MTTLVDTYREFVGSDPPRRGNGPWWLVLAINTAPKARSKTQMWCHSNPALQLVMANQVERGFSKWVPAIEIGPFRYERSANAFFQLWGKQASKERGSRVLWALLLFEVYREDEDLQLNICDADALKMTEEQLLEFSREREQAARDKRGRTGNLFSRRHRIWDLQPPLERRVTAGDVTARRERRAKRKRKKK
jgi:hypothetical protein